MNLQPHHQLNRNKQATCDINCKVSNAKLLWGKLHLASIFVRLLFAVLCVWDWGALGGVLAAWGGLWLRSKKVPM